MALTGDFIFLFCDYVWGYGYIPKTLFCGSGCSNGSRGGVSGLCLDYTDEYVAWNVGACIFP